MVQICFFSLLEMQKIYNYCVKYGVHCTYNQSFITKSTESVHFLLFWFICLLQEFVVQHDENANPPTFFLTLESLLNQMEKNNNTVSMEWMREVSERNERVKFTCAHTIRFLTRSIIHSLTCHLIQSSFVYSFTLLFLLLNLSTFFCIV